MFIAKVSIQRPQIRIKSIAESLGVSRSGYYRHFFAKKRPLDKADYEMIRVVFEDRKCRIGIRQIKMLLERRFSIKMNLKKILRIKRKYGLETLIRKKNKYKFFAKKRQEHHTFKNKLARRFKVNKPDKVYSTDITEMHYGKGQKAYLAAVKDLCTKEIVGFSVSQKADVKIAIEALTQALNRPRMSNKLMVHSDQGYHFTHYSFRKILRESNIKQSMSRKGNCLDNAPIESLFGHLKDHIDLGECITIYEVKEVVTREIEYYNNHRPQMGLKKMPPAEYRRHLQTYPGLF
jgi:transposase InsO family protein